MIHEIHKITKPDRIVNIIVEQIIDFIKSGKIQKGEKLPSEKELAEAFGVGRSSIREAFQALELSGYVVTKKGVGRFLIKDYIDEDSSNLHKWVEAVPYLQLVDARLHLEVLMIKLAVERSSEEIIKEMEETIEKMSREVDNIDSFQKIEFHFHQIIYEACENEVLTELMSTITERIFKESDKLRKSYVRNAESAIVDAKEIMAAFIANDADQAMKIMQRHIEQIRITCEDELLEER
ncbi:FadR/GntR family transcriptional regulator [Anaerobacillus sp. MEB173]|uniref:FadR/GntR family transcriptional regulator n=1 Tax=Anaerobacillus sp. MEB173 TaxID=3383345 RepID=UPI003F8DFF12